MDVKPQPILGLLFSLLTGLSVAVYADSKICDQVLASVNQYSSAFDELATGQINLEKMRIDGATEASRLSLKKALSKKSKELIKIFGEVEFSNYLNERIKLIKAALEDQRQSNHTSRKNRFAEEAEAIAPLGGWELSHGPEESVSKYWISPKSDFFVVVRHHAGQDFIELRDLRSKKTVHTLQSRGHSAQYGAFNRDGSLFAAGLFDPIAERRAIQVWNVKTGLEHDYTVLETDERFEEIVFEGNSIFALTDGFGSQNGGFRIYRWNIDKKSRPVDLGLRANRMVVSPDGNYVVSSFAKEKIVFTSVVDGSKIPIESKRMNWIKISPNSKFVLSKDEDKLSILDIQTGAEVFSLLNNVEYVEDASWSADGSRLITLSALDFQKITIRNRDTMTYSVLNDVPTVMFADRKSQIIDGGKILDTTVSDPGGARTLYDLSTGLELGRFPGSFTAFSLSPNLRHVLVRDTRTGFFSIHSAFTVGEIEE